MNPVDTAEPMRSRWSPSVFDATHELADADVTRLLEAAQWAPSAGNRQPWRYVVAPRGSAAHAVVVAALSRGNSGWVPRASLVLVSVAALEPDPQRPDELKDLLVPLHDLGQATAHLVLQAHAMGLHAHQFSGFDHGAVAEGLGVPPPARVVAAIAVGVRAAPGPDVDERDVQREQRERTRRPLAGTAFGERWGQAWTGLPH